VWKPEATWLGKDRAFFAREVAVYELDQKLTRTGIVPPTVETMLDLDGKGARVGSMQWMVEGARQLGLSPTEHDPRFDAFRQSARYREQESNIRMLLYLFSDPDKLSNNVIATPNLANILVDRDEKLWMIDNGYSLGAPPAEVSPSILPKQLPAQTSRPPSVIEPPTLWQRVADAFLESETVRALVARANRLKAWLGGDESVRPRSPQ
jgi:hypothetical protein